MGGGASAKVEKKKEDSDSSDSDWVEEDDHKDVSQQLNKWCERAAIILLTHILSG